MGSIVVTKVGNKIDVYKLTSGCKYASCLDEEFSSTADS